MSELPAPLNAALRSFLRRFPKVYGNSADAGKHLQHPDRVSKSLNVSPNYQTTRATHFRSGILELIQNWHDQCKVVGGSAGLAVQDLTPPAAAAGGSLLLNGMLLNGMHSSVLLQGQSSASAFYLYCDPTDGIIAFNLGRPGEAGECWYNAAYDPPETDPVSRAKHWFLTTCHELAHNFVRAHNSAFADVMGQIVLRYADRFRGMYDPA